MNIGIDVDGVIFDSENWFRTFATFYNSEHFKSVEVDREELYFQKRYLWTPEQEHKFYNDCYEEIEAKAPLMPYAKMVIQKLKSMGHKLYIITTRGATIPGEIDISKKRFAEENLEFDGYFFASKNKAEVCKNLNIDVMIDDLYDNVEKIIANGIRCLYYRDLVLRQFDKENTLVHEVRNWGDIYQEILNFENWKI